MSQIRVTIVIHYDHSENYLGTLAKLRILQLSDIGPSCLLPTEQILENTVHASNI